MLAPQDSPNADEAVGIRRAGEKGLGSRGRRRHRVSVLGLGTMGMRHVRVLSSLRDRFELVGVYDVRGDLQSVPHVRPLRGEAEAIALADVVVVATPIEAHGGAVARALSAGRHVLVEKPLCPTSAEARALAAASLRGPAHLFVGHSERFNPVVRTLARVLRRDRVLAIDLRRIGPSRNCDFGVLLNLGVHDFDLAAYLGGGGVVLQSALGGRDFAHALFATGAGAIGHVFLDGSSPARKRAIAVTTERWTYEGDLLRVRLFRTARGRAVRTEVPLPIEEPLRAQAIALGDALDGGGHREIATGTDGAMSVDLAERAALHCASVASTENLSVIGPA
jgi:UDP-N-acetylglucosamine 3-dehydrogenase